MGEKGYSKFNVDNAFLNRIAQHLIMHTSFMHDLSLYHGKMGIILFFVHYARYTGNPLYEEFAGELLDEVCEDIHTGLPVNFESGLCGIGWGIEYLFQHGFLNGDSDEILSEIDAQVMERDLRRITDRSLRTGLEGVSCYINKRINSPFRKSRCLPFDKIYLTNWKLSALTLSIPEKKVVLDDILKHLPEGKEITAWRLGLENGCAGVGLKMMME